MTIWVVSEYGVPGDGFAAVVKVLVDGPAWPSLLLIRLVAGIPLVLLFSAKKSPVPPPVSAFNVVVTPNEFVAVGTSVSVNIDENVPDALALDACVWF